LAFNTGAGAIGTKMVGFLGGTATLALAEASRSVLARTLVASLFATPAAYAG